MRMFSLKVLLVLLLCRSLLSARLGLYDIKLTRLSNCEDMGTGEMSLDLEMHKESTHKAVFTGYVNFGRTLDDHVAGDWLIAEWRSGGWGLNALRDYSTNYCVGLKTKLPEFWNLFFRAIRLNPMSCPVKAGNYSVHSLPADIPRLARIPYLPYGNFRLDNNYYLNGNKSHKLGCFQWFGSVLERPRN